MSEGLRRQLGEPVGYEPRKQAAAFVNSCLREGLSTDAIVILARGHEPCRALGESTDADGLDPALAERRLEGIIAAQREARKQAEGSPFLDWWAPPESFSEPDYCITKLIRQGDSVSIVGPPKVGKSLLVLEAVTAKATGRPFLQAVAPAGAVLYWDCENRPGEVFRRLATMNVSFDELPDLHYLSLPAHPRLDTPEGAARALDLVKKTGARLFVIDTLQRVLGGEEESSTGIRSMYQYFLAPLRRDGVSVLRLDHFGKDRSRGPRGTSAKTDDVDESYALTLTKEGLLQLTKTHSRYEPAGATLLLERTSSPLRHELLAESREEQQGAVAVDQRSSGDSRPLTPEQLVTVLDELSVPGDAGRPKATEALKVAGVRYRTEALAAAVRSRKERDLPQ